MRETWYSVVREPAVLIQAAERLAAPDSKNNLKITPIDVPVDPAKGPTAYHLVRLDYEGPTGISNTLGTALFGDENGNGKIIVSSSTQEEARVRLVQIRGIPKLPLHAS